MGLLLPVSGARASEEQGEDEPPPDAHYGRAGVEVGLLLGAGTGLYWIMKDVNSRDWEYSRFSQRLELDAIRFDNNDFGTNHLFHPLDGAAYHVFSRVNGLSGPEATLVTIGASTLWEGAFEFKEKVSINDLIATPTGGVAAGEFLVKLGDYVNSAPGGGGGLQRGAAWTLGFPRALHRALDDVPPPAGPADALGFSARTWHRFELMAMAGTTGFTGVGFAAELITLPGFLRRPHVRRFFDDGDLTRASFDLGLSTQTSGDLDLKLSTVLFGYHSQDLTTSGDQPEGTSAMAGVSMGWDYRRLHPPGPTDGVAVFHLPGLAIDLRRLWAGGVRAHLAIDGAPDFAALQLLAWEPWRAEAPEAVSKSVLESHGYDYAFGASGRLTVDVAVGGFEAGGSVWYGMYDTVEGQDRFQEQVTREARAVEQLVELSGWTGYVSEAGVLARLEAHRWQHRSRLENVEVEFVDDRCIGRIGVRF